MTNLFPHQLDTSSPSLQPPKEHKNYVYAYLTLYLKKDLRFDNCWMKSNKSIKLSIPGLNIVKVQSWGDLLLATLIRKNINHYSEIIFATKGVTFYLWCLVSLWTNLVPGDFLDPSYVHLLGRLLLLMVFSVSVKYFVCFTTQSMQS